MYLLQHYICVNNFSTATVNPNDFDDVGPKKSKDFHFSVNFEGIALHVAHQRLAVAYAKVSG